jgi:hypothetical protein
MSVSVAQHRSDSGEPDPKPGGLTDCKGPLKPRDGLLDVAFAQVQSTEILIRLGNTERMLDRLGALDRFFADGDSLGELAELGQAQR